MIYSNRKQIIITIHIAQAHIGPSKKAAHAYIRYGASRAPLELDIKAMKTKHVCSNGNDSTLLSDVFSSLPPIVASIQR